MLGGWVVWGSGQMGAELMGVLGRFGGSRQLWVSGPMWGIWANVGSRGRLGVWAQIACAGGARSGALTPCDLRSTCWGSRAHLQAGRVGQAEAAAQRG